MNEKIKIHIERWRESQNQSVRAQSDPLAGLPNLTTRTLYKYRAAVREIIYSLIMGNPFHNRQALTQRWSIRGGGLSGLLSSANIQPYQSKLSLSTIQIEISVKLQYFTIQSNSVQTHI